MVDMLTIGLNGGTAMAFMEADWFQLWDVAVLHPVRVAAGRGGDHHRGVLLRGGLQLDVEPQQVVPCQSDSADGRLNTWTSSHAV